MGCGSSMANVEEPDDELSIDDLVVHERFRATMQLPDSFKSKYQLCSLLGSGSFSQVVRAVDQTTKEPVAVKIIEKSSDDEKLRFLHTELAILRRARHPNVIRLVDDVHETPDHIFMIMELATGGSLLERIMERGKFKEVDASSTIAMILLALVYLHNLGIAHRDLKPENLLYYHPGPDAKLMVTDFGLSFLKDTGADFIMSTMCGSPEYIAPEILEKRPYTPAVDMWSLGVITYILLSGYLPFENQNRQMLFSQIIAADYEFHPTYWGTISRPAKDFIQRLLVADPKFRMTAMQALSHEWIVRHWPSPSRLSVKSGPQSLSSRQSSRPTSHTSWASSSTATATYRE